MSYCVVMTTCAKREEAEILAGKIIENRLAACVQLSEIVSFYTWEGDMCKDPEIRLTIKTTDALFPELESFITANHSYDVPQIVIPICTPLSQTVAFPIMGHFMSHRV
jgi:periplasmic divalent cation tolerance protein